MLRSLWNRFTARRVEAAKEHEVERERMTPAERRDDDKSFEDKQADRAVESRLGGIDPERLLDDDR